jgi:EVE domain
MNRPNIDTITVRFVTARTVADRGRISRLEDFKTQVRTSGLITKWRATKGSRPGDLALFYFAKPKFEISAVGRVDSKPVYGPKGEDWQGDDPNSKAYFCSFKPVWLLENPLSLSGGTENPTLKEWWAGSPTQKPKDLKGAVASSLLEMVLASNASLIPALIREFGVGDSALAVKLRSLGPVVAASPDYAPTADEDEFNRRVSKLRKGKITFTPAGQEKPAKVGTAGDAYVRDPLVKAWVLQNAEGKCEGCGNPAPFVGGDGVK